MFLEVPEFNKYLFYFMCLVADIVYLIWITYFMFKSKLIRNIAIFSIIYITLTIGLVILYFYLGDKYPENLGLNGANVAKWSRYDLISIFSGVGVFMAPIAVLLGFNAWKKQQFESYKIKAIEEIKAILTKQHTITMNYRLYKDIPSLLFQSKINEFQKNEDYWSDEFEKLRTDIVCALQNNGFYFQDTNGTLKKLYDLNNGTLKIINNIEGRSFQLMQAILFDATIVPEDGEPDDQEFLKNKIIYLLNPTHFGLKRKLDADPNLKQACKDIELKEINIYFNEFFDYLNGLLTEVYE